ANTTNIAAKNSSLSGLSLRNGNLLFSNMMLNLPIFL
ncbi:MAG: hypothetical protein ACI9DJ_000765, partial [Algoriphagus sp.]